MTVRAALAMSGVLLIAALPASAISSRTLWVEFTNPLLCLPEHHHDGSWDQVLGDARNRGDLDYVRDCGRLEPAGYNYCMDCWSVGASGLASPTVTWSA